LKIQKPPNLLKIKQLFTSAANIGMTFAE